MSYRKRTQALYRSPRWKTLRANHLSRHPFCQCPHHDGKRIKEKRMVVDHKTPHRGNLKLFWDSSNLQTMTKTCHDKFKQSQEKGGAGFLMGCDEHGMPLSKEHDWYAGQ